MANVNFIIGDKIRTESGVGGTPPLAAQVQVEDTLFFAQPPLALTARPLENKIHIVFVALGALYYQTEEEQVFFIGSPDAYGVRRINTPDQVLYAGMEKAASEGSPEAPALAMQNGGRFRFRVAFLTPGLKTLQIRVKQAANVAPRPLLRVYPNPEIGVDVEIDAEASSDVDWVTIGPVTLNITAKGALWVELYSRYAGGQGGAPCYWDHLEQSSL